MKILNHNEQVPEQFFNFLHIQSMRINISCSFWTRSLSGFLFLFFIFSLQESAFFNLEEGGKSSKVFFTSSKKNVIQKYS